MAAHDVEGRIHSRGSRALLSALQKVTQVALAQALGVKRARLGHWANGRHKPEFDGRQACFRCLGIPLDWWDLPPANDTTPPMARELPSAARLAA